MTYNNLLGDYDADWDVDVEDLNAFVNAWPNVDIGPATGTSPYLTPSFDSALRCMSTGLVPIAHPPGNETFAFPNLINLLNNRPKLL